MGARRRPVAEQAFELRAHRVRIDIADHRDRRAFAHAVEVAMERAHVLQFQRLQFGQRHAGAAFGHFFLLARKDALQHVMQMLEQPEGLVRLLHNITQDDTPKLLLGKESGYVELANVSLIAQRYQAQPARFIALLGPRRMNYARLIPLVEACARQLNLNLNRR